METRGGGCHDDRRGCEDEDFSGYFKSLRRRREEEEVDDGREGGTVDEGMVCVVGGMVSMRDECRWV